MEIVPVSCNNCGAALDIGPETHFATCRHCGSRLVVKRTASTAYTEVLGRLEQKTDTLVAKMDELTRQNEIERIDREWEQEKERYMVAGKHGTKHLPSRTVGWILLVAMPIFGLFWIVATKHSALTMLPFLGVVFIGLGISLGVHQMRKAAEYEAARDRYFARRERALKDREPTDATG